MNFPSHFITTFKGILQCFENIPFQSRSLFGSALIYIWCYGSVLGLPMLTCTNIECLMGGGHSTLLFYGHVRVRG